MTQRFGVFSLASVKDLPTLPAVASMAVTVAEDPNSSARDLLRVCMSDPPLAAKVLRVANSAFFRRGVEVTDLQTAIVRLGFENVRNLILGISVYEAMDSFFTGSAYTREDFWKHSVSVGTLAGQIAARQGIPSTTAFVIGLLHDVGKLVLDLYAWDEFRQILDRVEEEKLSFVEAENRTIHTNHAAIGGDLLELWHFPMALIESVRWHHAPGLCAESYRPYAILTNIADYYCNLRKLGHSGNLNPAPPHPDHLQLLGMEEADLEALVDTLEWEPLGRLLTD